MAATFIAARPTRRLLFILLAAGLLCAGLWLAGLVYFATNLPQQVADPARTTDAIVVLTGGSGRIRQGFELLEQDRAQQLFVSGVERSVEVAELLRIDRIAPPRAATPP